MSETYKPPAPHPGELIGEFIDKLRLSVAEAAKEIGMTRPSLSNLVHGHRRIGTRVAKRIGEWAGPEMDAEYLLTVQLKWDLEHADDD